MTDDNWRDLCSVEELTEQGKVCERIRDTPLVAVQVDGQLFCLEDVCPHAGLPLGDGEVRGRTITCPYHAYTYRLSDGADIDDPDFGEPAQTVPIRIEGGRVQVRLP